tara:strand:- start:64 stop:225 length:162 start_codon:yes stop_codon:yes gene_type:complete
MEVAVNVQTPPFKTVRVKRYVRHNKTLPLYVASNVVKDVEVLTHLRGFVVTRY